MKIKCITTAIYNRDRRSHIQKSLIKLKDQEDIEFHFNLVKFKSSYIWYFWILPQ